MGITLACGHYSYAEAPLKYDLRLGVTGTIESLHKVSRDIIKNYINFLYKTPSMFGSSKLHFDKTGGLFICMNESEYFMKIKDIAIRRLE